MHYVLGVDNYCTVRPISLLRILRPQNIIIVYYAKGSTSIHTINIKNNPKSTAKTLHKIQ